MRKEEERRENSYLILGIELSGLEWSCLASKNMRDENGLGEGIERMRWRRGSLRWIRPRGDFDRRCISSESTSSEELEWVVMGERRKRIVMSRKED